MRRGKAWQVQRGSRVEGWKGEGGEAKVESVGGGGGERWTEVREGVSR